MGTSKTMGLLISMLRWLHLYRVVGRLLTTEQWHYQQPIPSALHSHREAHSRSLQAPSSPLALVQDNYTLDNCDTHCCYSNSQFWSCYKLEQWHYLARYRWNSLHQVKCSASSVKSITIYTIFTVPTLAQLGLCKYLVAQSQ